MDRNHTSSNVISNGCPLSRLQFLLHTLASEVSFYMLAVLGISYVFAVAEVLLTIVALCTIRGWKSSTRQYYYVIAIANLVAVFTSDWNTFLLAFNSWVIRWFPSKVGLVTLLHWEHYWPPLCALYNFVTRSTLIPKLWVIILFCVHRTWIVLQPLRAPFVKRVFRPHLVIGLPVGLIVFIIPQLFLSEIVNGVFLFY